MAVPYRPGQATGTQERETESWLELTLYTTFRFLLPPKKANQAHEQTLLAASKALKGHEP